MAHANVAAIFCGLRTWITFRVFVLETCWWHGVPVRVPPLCCECCYNGGDKNNERYCCGGCTCVLSSLTFCLSLGCCMGRSSDESSQLSSTMNTGNSRGHTNSVDGTNKLNILDGVDLTQSAGNCFKNPLYLFKNFNIMHSCFVCVCVSIFGCSFICLFLNELLGTVHG